MQARSCILVASSPEILCRVDLQGEVTNRPLAGTRKRGATEEEDCVLAKDLLADDKERAEHIMLVDLGRNDVGRVSEAGSVNVEKFMEIERYSHVMHISSTVKGELLSSPYVCTSGAFIVVRVTLVQLYLLQLHTHVINKCAAPMFTNREGFSGLHASRHTEPALEA
jgi:chorismate binding enzyme